MKKLSILPMITLALLTGLFLWAPLATAQEKFPSEAGYPEKYFHSMTWRHIGPFRGGRSCAVTGVPDKPNLYYFGSSGGGVWKTEDGGRSWENISDGFFGGSVGSIAVSEWDPNVIYAGGGEKTVRGNVSYGYGVWRSEDAGHSWMSAGLEDSRHISRIRIHPRKPELIYAAVMGDLFKPTRDRGVYRSRDGGRSWEQVLFVNEDAGAVDLCMDPTNPRILYATTWRIRRTPYSLESGGEGSSIFRSTDGGDNWEEIREKEGLPEGLWGISGIAISPVDPDRIFALIEAEEGGVFRSDDRGETWKQVNSERALRQRAWYYTRIYADTEDADVVYVVNVAYHKSKDGGKTFQAKYAPHGDHHDLWIAPKNPRRMIIGDDGGAQVTYDGGQTWTTYHNQPTAQFYRVTTDNHFPFRIYAAQQDNSTIRILHRSFGWSIGSNDWEATAGGESAHLAPDPNDPEIVYGGSYGGYLTRMNHRLGSQRAINVWPDNPMGHGAEGMRYRFQWNFPIFFSPHDPDKLYTASNHLHVSYDEGQSWEVISPDLSRNDSAKLGPSGGSITKDNTGVEYYCTIFAAAESPLKKDLLWVGSDDGLVHLSRDGGVNWENVTPPQMPEWIQVNSIEPDPFLEGGCYLAATLYKSGDYRPFLYRTKDYGQTWSLITEGIDPGHFTRVVRSDTERPGLLFAGTESGMYLSFDYGANWQPFQLDLPVVPVTDLHIREGHLIAATQGRGLWVMDDLSPIRKISKEVTGRKIHLYEPAPCYRLPGGYNEKVKGSGVNHPNGVIVHFYLEEQPSDSTEVVLRFLDADGREIRSFSNQAEEKKDQLKDLQAGANRFIWDLFYPNAEKFEGIVLWWANLKGPRAVPGQYVVELVVGDQKEESRFEVLGDPRSPYGLEGYREQFEFLEETCEKLTEMHLAIRDIRSLRTQLTEFRERYKVEEGMSALVEEAERMDSLITRVEKELYQTKNRSGQDPLNFPIRLNNKLAHLNSLVRVGEYYPPTDQAYAFREEIFREIDSVLADWVRVREEDIPAFNRKVLEMEVEYLRIQNE